jgi:hypothetical protein
MLLTRTRFLCIRLYCPKMFSKTERARVKNNVFTLYFGKDYINELFVRFNTGRYKYQGALLTHYRSCTKHKLVGIELRLSILVP